MSRKRTERTVEPVYLNIGSGDKKLPGFINVDLEAGADVQCDVTNGLPFENNSVDLIFSEHFIEHINQAEGINFFRECRRVLKPGGIVRVATPDLDHIIQRYGKENWRAESEMINHGWTWVDNVCEQLNLSMRSWGHQWVYNEGELRRVGEVAGLDFKARFERSVSDHPDLQGLEYRPGSRLVIEFRKPEPVASDGDPLVSVLITAYKPDFFREALESAVQQTYRNLEIIVCDDSMGGEIEAVTTEYAHDPRLRYVKNAENIGGRRNYIQCFERATGIYIKFLNDDDRLHPDCVRRMVAVMEADPDISLVTSHRQLIDADGNPLPEAPYTVRPVQEDSRIEGMSMAETVLRAKMNFIGEPSSTLFRRRDLATVRPDIFSVGGRSALRSGDVSMWVNLLGKGDLVYLVDSLSEFRIHEKQKQNDADFRAEADQAWEQLRFDATRMGYLHPRSSVGIKSVPLAPERESGAEDAPPLISIIIPIFNKVDLTRQCLDSLLANTRYPNWEVWIIDNGSTDDSEAVCSAYAREHDHIRYWRNPSNLGFSGANNMAARMANGEYLVLLNNDTEVKPNWLTEMAVVLINDPEVGVVGSKLLFPDGTLQHAGVVICDDRPGGGNPGVARHIYYKGDPDQRDANIPMCYQVVTGACLMVRKRLYNQLGGLDEGFWNGYEDVDFCLSVGAAGYKVVYQPRSVLVHHESQSGAERFSRVSQNVRRLANRWEQRIVHDVVISRQGTERSKESPVCTYVPPRPFDDMVAAVRRRAAVSGEPRVSIVILSYNALDYTRKCLDSIERYTPVPHEIILVDNGSDKRTRKALRNLARRFEHVTVIWNEENRGFAAGNNQGVDAARGEYVLLLNNDVLVGDGWLEGLLTAIEVHPRIGMVGPITNHISGRQMVAEVPYSDEAGFLEFAARVRRGNAGKVTPRRRIAGFAVLMRRDRYRQIGGFDESFGSGNFEDDDLCLRVREAGWAVMVDESTFIHHYGSQTFKANGMDYAASLEEKGARFREKWPEVAHDHLLEQVDPLDIAHPRDLEAATADLLAGRVHEAITALDGITREDPLNREAAMARVMAYRMAGDIENALAVLREMLAVDPNDAATYNELGLVRAAAGNITAAVADFERAIRLDNGFVDAQRNYADILIRQGDFQTGVLALYRILDNHPEDVPTLLYLAQIQIEAERPDVARPLLERVLDVDPEQSQAREMLAGLGGASDPAGEEGMPATDLSEAAAATLNEAHAALETHDLDAALENYQTVLDADPRLAEALYGAGLVQVLRDEPAAARALFERLVASEPRFPDGHFHLARLLLQDGENDAALHHFQTALELDPANLPAQLHYSEALIATERFDDGVRLLMNAAQRYPEDPQVLVRLGHVYREAGQAEESRRCYETALKHDPENPAAREGIEHLQTA